MVIIDALIFFVVLPLIFLTIIYLFIWIRKKERYDVFFHINWETLQRTNRKKLLNRITAVGIVYASISATYFPLIHILALDKLKAIFPYFGFVILIVILIYSAIKNIQGSKLYFWFNTDTIPKT